MSGLVNKADVLDIYAELYDVFEDNKAICAELNKVYNKLNGLPSTELEPQVARDIATIIENEKDMRVILQKPGWIPCSERLPENDEPVLISHSHGVAKAWWNGRFWSSVSIKKYKTVVAWMPLPEPYSEDEE